MADAASAEITTEADPDLAHPRPVPTPDPAQNTEEQADKATGSGMLDALMAEVDVLVKVLGDVTISRPNGDDERCEVSLSKVKATEAAVYLALRESAVPRDDVQAALWPGGDNSSKTFNNVIAALRSGLGDDRDSERLLPQATSGRYLLSPRVVTDYGLFWTLVEAAEDIEDANVAADVLSEALCFVEGEPFTGLGRSFAWSAAQAGMMVAQIVDAAEEVAEVRLATGNWRQAEWAARQGLRAMPSDERMYRLLMCAGHAAGSRPGVHRAFRELCDAVADPDEGCEPHDTVHPETITLLEELTGNRRASA